jgi:hypothetical protein
MTTNHPAHGPVSLDRLHQIREILSKASAQSDGGNLGYAMSDAVKVIDVAIAEFGAEPVLYAAEETLAYAKMGELHLKFLSRPMGDAVIPLYAAPRLPQPEVPDEKVIGAFSPERNEISLFDSAVSVDRFAHWHCHNEFEVVIRPCRAAMLQGAEPVQEWIPCSERMPDKLIPVMVMYEDGEMWSAMWNGNHWDDGTEYPDPRSVTHWRKMPAAPQQEVKCE